MEKIEHAINQPPRPRKRLGFDLNCLSVASFSYTYASINKHKNSALLVYLAHPSMIIHKYPTCIQSQKLDPPNTNRELPPGICSHRLTCHCLIIFRKTLFDGWIRILILCLKYITKYITTTIKEASH